MGFVGTMPFAQSSLVFCILMVEFVYRHLDVRSILIDSLRKFLVASVRLFSSLCPSNRRSVGPSVESESRFRVLNVRVGQRPYVDRATDVVYLYRLVLPPDLFILCMRCHRNNNCPMCMYVGRGSPVIVRRNLT